MRKKKQLLMVMLCAFSMLGNNVAVVAQGKDKKQEPKSGAEQAPEAPNLLISAPFTQPILMRNEFGFSGHVVKDAPYSADAVTETTQILGDGNRIIQNSSAKIYRDSAGRTRHEQSLKAIGPWAVSGEAPIMISIDDSASGVHYNLDSNTKIAHKIVMPLLLKFDEAAKSRAEWAKKKDKLKLKTANGAEPGANTGVVIGTSGVREPGNIVDFRVAQAGGGVAPRAVVSAIGPGVPMAGVSRSLFWSGDGEVNQESLGSQTIEGVVAEGTRVTITIPAGKIGNERPIITVNEQWYSPELQTVVLSKNSDPRMGETTYRLTNIDRSEPDPSLFQVPADYTVDEGRGFGFRTGPPGPLKKRRLNDN